MTIKESNEEYIFNFARKIEDDEARADYLRLACGDNEVLRRRVGALLEAHEGERGFLSSPGAVIEISDRPNLEDSGTLIGPYKLLEKIGEGGFGLVFMAEQQQPVRRKVAIKILKPGMDSRRVLARFEAESQALALMDHLHIARVLDAGETASGRPYFAMELVRGIPITAYCDKNGLTAWKRLTLFLTVCQAVQHAHQKGIIHRDLKPSNILVTLHDGTPVVKVIDFGIAKAIGQQLTDKTLYTGFAQMIGTPLYMSPEQAEMTSLDIDTRSDIYSLGVLLYELLTGSTPFDQERLGKAGYDELRRIVREEEPAKPSTQMSTMGAAATGVAARRQSDPKRLSQLFRGELDWIVMKALEKERGRRYETAAAFAADIEHYLRDEPVSACPPSAWYRFGKMARRNKGPLATAALVSVALIAGTVVSVWQAIRATGAANSERQALVNLGKEQKATQRELFESLVAQARANRRSRRIGQRFRTLELVREATMLGRELGMAEERFLELRNEAVAAMALPDLRADREWPFPVNLGVSFDGALERYACTDSQGMVQVFRVVDGKAIYNLPDVGPGGNWTNLSPDGGYLGVFEAGRGRMHVWKLTGAEPPQILNVRADGRAYFSPDSRQLVVQEPDGSIGLFNLATSKEVRRLPCPEHASHIAWHPSGKQLALACTTFVQVRDLETGDVFRKKEVAANAFRWAEWHPDGKTLAVEDGEGISLWDVTQDKLSGRLEGVLGGGLNLTFNPPGTMLVCTGWAGVLKLWDPHTGRQLFGTYARIQNQAPQFSADGHFLAAIQHDKKVGIWKIAAPNEFRTLTASPLKGNRPYGEVAISPDERFLAAAAGGANGAVALWDLATGKEQAFLEGSSFNHVAFAHRPPLNGVAQKQEATLFTMQMDGLFRRPIRVDPGSGAVGIEPTQKLPIPAVDAMIAQSRDGRVLASAQFKGVLVLHADQPDKPIKLEPHDDVRHVAVSPNGRWIAAGRWGYPGGIKIWELDKKGDEGLKYKFVKELPSFGLSLPLFSPDGKRLLATAVAAVLPIRRWDVGTWVEMPFEEPIEGQNAAFSTDGKLVVLEIGSGVARLIDADSGKEYARLEDPDQHRTGNFAFTPDGTKLACATGDGYCVHIWDLQAIRRQLAEMDLDWKQ